MSISATFTKETSRQKTAGQLREGAALRFPFYIRFADGSLPSGFLSAEIQPIQECCDLCAGAGGVGVEASAAHAGGDAVGHGPGHRLCVVSVSGNVGKRGRSRRSRLAERLIRSGEVPKYVYLQDIADASFLLPPPIYGGRYMIDQMFSAIGKKPHVLAQISPINASKSLVETGQYCTLSPELMSPPYAYESKYYTIPVLLSNDSNGLCERPIYMVYRKEIPLVSFQRAFIQIACSLCGGIIPS